jgi:hypothetical protein
MNKEAQRSREELKILCRAFFLREAKNKAAIWKQAQMSFHVVSGLFCVYLGNRKGSLLFRD